ncbi:GNAT family N-acetyltransferase [Ferruginibacter lapsinanis]|uniref:GNAT family N-acetyltransferase n=1 Tax=Ferruginibacter lapsinanis TaxID=563172 RepID=UPI001E5E54B1|nr:GNAT family protein [Ferruginibacter lapsinanis]UEG50496.1 GNAT family N-acetyltransferase [Ferruginibacter lapsinanis]
MIENIFTQHIILENDSVLLRPLELTDTNHLLPFVFSEPDTWFYSLQGPTDEASMKKYIATAIENRQQQKEYPFIIFDKRANEYAGSTRFYDIQQGFKTTQLGFTWYGKKFRRTGLNRHCKFLIFQFAFEQWDLERVELRADIRNERSINAMKGIGCTAEGILRKHLPNNEGGRRDSIVFSVLKEEWFNRVKEELQRKIY